MATFILRGARCVIPLAMVLSIQGCEECGPDHRRTEIEGVMVDRNLTPVARLEVFLGELRTGVNTQLWVQIHDFWNDPDSLLRGRVTGAALLSAADDTLFRFVVDSANERTGILAGGTVITPAEADRIMSHIMGTGVKLLIRSDVDGRTAQAIPMTLVTIGPWRRATCDWP
ncbi:MAG TPA: hypothetical protein VEB19_07815 [Gemmatimonadaceae bacterium]|nr:hypothetical protein [Gemmatimonadaceae bacterium]